MTTQIGGIWSAVSNRAWMLVVHVQGAVRIHRDPTGVQAPHARHPHPTARLDVGG
jgi:hypothetical protein